MNMLDFRLYLFLNVNLLLSVYAFIPEEKLCANLACSEPISQARGSVTYVPDIESGLGFQKGQEILITSKSNIKNGYWGAVSNGKFGYVPSNLIKEIKIYHPTEKLIVVKTETTKPIVEDKTSLNKFSLNSENKNNINDNINDKPISSLITENTNRDTNEFSENGLPGEEDINNNLLTLLNSNKNEHDSVLPLKPFKVIEGTTVFNDEINEILSSPATATKINTHTEIPELNNLNIKDENKKSLDEDKNIFKIQESNYQDDNNSSLLQEVKNYENVKLELSSETVFSNSFISNAENKNNEGKTEKVLEENKIPENINTINLNQPSDSISHEKVEANKENLEILHHEGKNDGNGDDDNNDEEEEEDEDGEVEEEEENEDDVEEPVFSTKNSNSEELNSQDVVEKKNLVDTNSSDLNPDLVQNDITTQKETVEAVNSNLQLNSKVININTPQQLKEFQSSTSQTDTGDFTSTNFDMNSTGAEMNLVVNDNIEEVKSKNIKSNEIFEPNNDSPIPSLSSYLNVNAQKIVEANNHPENQKNSYPEPLSNWDLINNPKDNAHPSNLAEKDRENFIAKESNLYPTPKSVNTESQKVSQTDSKEDSNFIFENKIQNNNVESLKLENVMAEKVMNTETTTENLNDISSTPISNFLSESESKTEKSKNDNPNEPVGEKNEVLETTSLNFEDPHPGLSKQPDTLQQESNIFSQLLDGITTWFNTYSNSGPIINNDFKDDGEVLSKQDIAKDLLTTKENILTAAAGFCEKEECTNNEEVEEQLSFWNVWTSAGTSASSNIFMYLVVTAVTVLLFTLGHNYIEAKGKTGPLIAKINKLEQEFLVTSKECLLLKDEVQNAREKIIMYENSTNDELVVALQKELEESKKIRTELETSIEVLHQELDAATEAGLDLNKMLSEVLTQKGGSESLLQSVENLQSQLNSQQKVIDEMTQKLGIKNKENEMLSAVLQGSQEKCESLEEQLRDIKENMNTHCEEKDALIENLKSEIHKLSQNKEQDIKKLNKNLEELKKKNTDTSGMLTVKEEELKILKNSVKHIKSKGNIDFEKLFDISRVKAELIKAQMDNETLSKKLQEEESSKKSSNDLLKSKEIEIQQMKEKCEEAEKNKEEAEKKLEVLSTYFKEKETQLQKELGLQEALWAQKKGDEKAVYNMMKSLQEEIESYKSQNETLKKEILDQERGLKNQIAALEQKAQENWVAARQAERKLEENKQQTAQLRNRLTLVEKNVNNDIEGKANHYTEELNGVEATSPILHNTSSPLLFPPLPIDPNSSSLLPPGFMPPHPMFIPPPMGGFIPPPPFLPGDRRPPPLGRMSSPPLNNRFSPPLPPDFPLGRMTSPPLSPHSRNYRSPTEADREREHFRHRTPPYPPMKPRNWEDGEEIQGFVPISSQRDPRREQKGSNVSSGHSSSDSLDQSSRHSGRV